MDRELQAAKEAMGEKLSDAAHEEGKKFAAEYGEEMRKRGEEAEKYGELHKASDYYLVSGLAGNPEGAYGYAKGVFWGWAGKSNYGLAREIFRMLRSRGYKKSACYFLGEYEEQGAMGAPDPEKAIELYTEGAEDGDYRCYRKLGEIYAEGKITEEDPEKAYHSFMMAAAIGDPVSVTNMALYTEEGYGCEKNIDRAVELYRMAADAGEENAIEALDRLGVR